MNSTHFYYSLSTSKPTNMKTTSKTLLSLVAFLFTMALSSNAQLKVTSNGNVGIGLASTNIPNSKLSINAIGANNRLVYVKGNNNCITAMRQGETNQTWVSGLEAACENISGGTSMGVTSRGYVNQTETGSGRSYGVYSRAGYATSGYNYGVLGVLMGSSYGAGVYGTSTNSDNGIYLDGRYAGYFRGNVKVTGDLTVNGNISGTLLSKGVSSQNERGVNDSSNDNNDNLSSRLGELSLVSYYESQDDYSRVIPHNDADTTEVVDPLTSIETQRITKQHYALPIEQLEQLFPDLVYELEDGTKAVNYMEMIPLLVGVVNELRTEINVLKGNNSETKSRSDAASITTTDDVTLYLGQNNPNPFSEQTSIEVRIPNDVKTASLCIYDMNGKQIDKIVIDERGTTRISILGTSLTEGMYLYSLIADGKVAGTKKMILTK